MQRFAVAAALAVALLCLVYAGVLSIGLMTLSSPQQPIDDPWFTLMEVLIIAIAPAMVVLTVVLHARANPQHKSLGVAAIAFMSMCAVVTCGVHFSILALSRQPGFVGHGWGHRVFSFEWPSVAYALDILAWDFFFPLAALFAAPTVDGTGRAGVARRLLYASAAVAFIGLAGIPLDDMQVRNIGIVGYAVLLPIAAAILASHFSQSGTASAS